MTVFNNNNHSFSELDSLCGGVKSLSTHFFPDKYELAAMSEHVRVCIARDERRRRIDEVRAAGYFLS